MYERIPEELKAVRQWHCWSLRGDVKIPVQPDGSPAKSNDPTTWTDLETAISASQYHSGLAFEITDPYCGIDLDNCIDEEGDLRQWAWEIVAKFDGLAWMEVSPSGRGIKIITRARKPPGARCLHKIADGKQQIECYDHARFWTITDDTYSQNLTIGDGQKAVNWLCEKFLSNEKKQEQKAPAAPVISVPLKPDNLLKRAELYTKSVPVPADGNRNNTAFKLTGQLRALIGQNHERLTESQVADLLSEWNARNPDPLTAEELTAACSSAGRNGTPREDKPHTPLPVDNHPEVDLSALLADIGRGRDDGEDDESFALEMVPGSGLLKQIFDYYCDLTQRRSNVMGLATAISLCETIFGRRIRSHTDLRTNDYNVVIAPTGAGKESCETTMSRILWQAEPNRVPMLPPDVQSGNGLLKAVSDRPCGLWVCDEFGKVLESILDKRSNNGHAKQIGTHLLKLYGKASGAYGGAAHAEGSRNEIMQPHLCLFGMTTWQVFESVNSSQITDGLFGRIAFWPVANRPKRRTARAIPAPPELEESVRQWISWEPANAIRMDIPRPQTIEMTPDALKRWEHHADAIDEKMQGESESRAGVWTRVAARAMKFALVHRAARLTGNPAHTDWQFVRLDLSDINWGIRLANWLGRIACDLIKETMVDTQHNRARQIVLQAASQGMSRRDITRKVRTISASEITAAATELAAEGKIVTREIISGGRPKTCYFLPESSVQPESG